MAEVRGAVSQHADQAERQRAEQHPRTELAPAAAGTIRQQPHARVGDGVERARQEEHGADESCGYTENIGIEEHHVQHDVIENDMAGGIAHTIANFLFDR